VAAAAAVKTWGDKDKATATTSGPKGAATTPGDSETVKSYTGETVASLVQSHSPINAFKTHVSTIKLYGSNPDRQISVHEYIQHINEDVMQGLLFDSDESDARLVGVEYIVTEKLFKRLPDEERKLWYSHAYEAKSGTMIAPRLPGPMEKKLAADMAPTYGKVVGLWQVDKHSLPMGLPEFMFGPTRDGVLSQAVMNQRDYDIGISSEKERQRLASVPDPMIIPGTWDGRPIRLELRALDRTDDRGRDSRVDVRDYKGRKEREDPLPAPIIPGAR
jgi:hypothetical protein